MDEILTIFISLIGVIALIFVTYFALRWMNKRVKFTSNSMVKVHEKVNFGADKAMMIISVGEKYMLIGVTQEHIEKVTDLEKTDIEGMIQAKNATPKMSFADAISHAIVNRNKKGGGDIDKE